ncbi:MULTISPECIES: porin [unclassified Vibrio]|uniref:porin n=1 Tax=unclassified Vibrio TaxID=2614977 RepID=UPI00136167D0|nr:MULTISPECIES: porin [unclassified Vibrio]NAW56128.1 porin [Vibrio sp. V36_P2S2PM302]NAX23757.1 porin [Vibrio sp. V39_P1S14PM300]NAX26381.1 porin [Vibrio sp. V38_P2S17PM301]NAX29474.1 porin [Vibrio sp. V37_P2S8PM304]
MKKTLLALAVATAATSVNAAEILKTEDGSVDFYGQLRTELKFLDDKDATLGSGSSRAGVDATYTVTDGFDILGKVEFGLKDNSDMYVRNHIFGIATDYGTIKLGKQWTTSDDVYGADYSYFFGGTALRYITLSDALHDSQIKYSLEKDNWWVKAGYGLDEDDTNQELAELFAGASFGDLALHVGGGKNTDNAWDGSSDEVSNTYYEATAEYTIGDALIGFTYYHAKLENEDNNHEIKENGYSLAGTYKVADKTTVYGGYEYTEQDPDFASDEDGTLIYAGVEYKFASWARVYAEYGYADGTTLGYSNKGSDATVEATTVDSENNFAIGARVYW